MDLNIYTNYQKRYKELSDEEKTVGGRSLKKLVNEFEWNKHMINYVRRIRSFIGGMDWAGAKRVLTVMNLKKTHFVTLEIILHQGHMNVYDCKLIVWNMTSF